MISRRSFLKYSTLATVTPFVDGCGQSHRWRAEAFRKERISRVAVLEVLRYDLPLREIITKGVQLCGLEIKGKTIVLKPNLVEFDPNGVINTNPLVIEAAIDCFRTLGARQVLVAEGPGHRRDNEYLLTASGIYGVIKEHRVPYVDLNSDAPAQQFYSTRAPLPAGDSLQCRSSGINAEVKNTSLGGSHAFVEKHVRCGPGLGLWLAQKHSSLAGDSQ